MDQITLRKVQLVQLEIAKEIKRVCEQNNIGYFLDSGTLLGAVRHKGFIPWDDDMDMGMLRADYEHFLRIAPQALNPQYVLLCWQEDERYPHQFAKVMKRGTLYHEETNHGGSFEGIFVDVFPYDRLPEDRQALKHTRFCLTAYRAMIRAKCKYQTWTSHGKFHVKRWIKNLPFRILSLFYKRADLRMRYDRLAQSHNQDAPFRYYVSQGVETYGDWCIPHHCLEEFTELPFEDTSFRVPKDYDAYLTHAYGNYMTLPPVEKRGDQHSIVEVHFGDACDTYAKPEMPAHMGK